MSEAIVAIEDQKIELDGAHLRAWERVDQFAVTAENLAAYAAATGDTRTRRLAGDEAGPAYAFVPFTALLFAAAADIGGDLLMGRLVHTHQQFAIDRAIVAGDALTITARISRLQAGPFGTVLEMSATTVDAGGERVNTQTATCLVAGSTCVNPIGEPLAPVRPESAAGRRAGATTATVTIDADHPQRYADASGDRNPIHLDPAVARGIGFPGVIVHGMCTLALSVSAIEAAHPESEAVRVLEIEFTRPVFPRDKLTVRWHEEASDDGVLATFDVVNRKQRTVMRGGRLDLRTA